MKRVLAAAALITAALISEASAQQTPPQPQPQPLPQQAQTQPLPPRPIVLWPAVYFRADAGGAFALDSSFKDTNFAFPTLGDDVRLQGGTGNSAYYNLGVGARFSPFLRVDLTVSYIPSLHFSGTDNFGFGTSNTANIYSVVGMANLYLDVWPFLTIFGPFQPYFNFGLGAASNHVGAMNSGFIEGSFASHTTTSFAVGFGVGVAWPISRNVALDLAYRFMDLGDMETGQVTSTAFTGIGTSPIRSNLSVNIVSLGVRVGF